MKPVRTPSNCRPEAYELFRLHLRGLESPRGLLHTAIAISLHELRSVDPFAIEDKLQGIADRIVKRAQGSSERGLLAHAHEVFFEEEGFRGNEEEYDHPYNSYISRVIETKRGLPITLSLVYKNVLERAGLVVHGLNLPGHFIVRVHCAGQSLFIDPFYRGRPLRLDEIEERVRSISGLSALDVSQLHVPATHSEWIARILNNLEHSFYRRENRDKLMAMLELRQLLARE